MSTSRRASEDSRFRVFLSSHFDAQTYVTNIIKEGRSEEGFNEISSYIQEVNNIFQAFMADYMAYRSTKKSKHISQCINMI
jgi:hypothetical protein